MSESLHAAARSGNTEAVRTLVERRPAAVHERDPDWGTTALHWAAKADNLAMAELLIRGGADVDAKDSSGRTPLDWLLLRDERGHQGRRAMIGLLISHGATHTFETALRRGTIQHIEPWLQRHSTSVPLPDGSSPLAFAAEYGDPDVVQLLLQRGANPDGEAFDAHSPLRRALRAQRADVVEVLLRHGADPARPDESGSVPLDEVTQLMRYGSSAQSLGRLLLDHGAPPTPQWAAALNDIQMLDDALPPWGVNRRGLGGRTALAIAVDVLLMPVVTALLTRGADPNLADDQGLTPLHIGASYRFMTETHERAAIVQTLLGAGANPNARDNNGQTPLHSALSSLHSFGVNLDIVRLLVSAGADPHIRDWRGRLPTEQPGELFIDGRDPNPEDVATRYRAMVAQVQEILFGDRARESE